MTVMRFLLALVLFGAANLGWADSPTAAYPKLPPPLAVYDALVAPAAKGGSSAVSMVLHNPLAWPVTITGASSSMAERVLMQHYVQQNGVTQIFPLPQVTIPAGADLTVVPFGLEIRLLNATQDLHYGMDVPLTLTFSDGSTRTLRLTIENPDHDE